MTYRFSSNGRKVSLLGYGAMRLPMKEGASASIDQELLNSQVKLMLDSGVNYFDTAPVYCQGASEAAMGQALAASGYSRGEYVLATKLSNFAAEQYPLEKCREMFEHSLACLKTSYIDNYLIHAIGNGGFETFSKRYLENGALDWCVELRESRRIHNLGFSFHGDARAFDWCLAHHDKYKWDFCQIQMNYLDWRHAERFKGRNLNAENLYRRLTDLGIPVVVMEPLLGGTLARFNTALKHELSALDPDASLARWALRFCGTFPNVLTVLSGMTRTEHIEENLNIFSPLKPCSTAELAVLERAAIAYLNCGMVGCTNCSYCMPCPYGLDIPSLLAFRNACLTKDTGMKPREILAEYARRIPEPLRRAEHCTGCGRCRPHCPQQINIPDEIAAIDAAIDVLKGDALK